MKVHKNLQLISNLQFGETWDVFELWQWCNGEDFNFNRFFTHNFNGSGKTNRVSNKFK